MRKLTDYWMSFFKEPNRKNNWWKRKNDLCNEREAEIIRISGTGHVYHHLRYDQKNYFHYLLHLSFLTKQKDFMYIEEQVIPFQFRLRKGEVVEHSEIPRKLVRKNTPSLSLNTKRSREQDFLYNRHAAVQYAERWWNSYNPNFKKFSVDCTNYVSQCMFAGGAPMRGAPVRDQGWWYVGEDWSFSWAVAHSLRWYLSGSTTGLQGKEVSSAKELMPGDVICYDFEGDGRWDHNTIVVAKDVNDMPLVNAHTDNSRHRYWSYEDSTAWTPNIEYKFFQIGLT